jgi:hypothetical protein
MFGPSPSPSPYNIPTPNIRFGHYLWPMFWAVVAFLVVAVLVYVAYQAAKNYHLEDKRWSVGAPGVAAVVVLGIGCWQFATFWHRASVAARSVGGLGAVVALTVFVVGFIMLSD